MSATAAAPEPGVQPDSGALLSVQDLRVSFRTDDGVVHAVDGISYDLAPGQTLGIVGESGSGKTVSSLTALGLTRARGSDISGKIIFEGQDLVAMSDDDLRAIRGNDVAMIFQDPLSSLHPFYKGHGTGTTACHYPLTDQEIQSQLPAALTRADRPGQTAAPVTP